MKSTAQHSYVRLTSLVLVAASIAAAMGAPRYAADRSCSHEPRSRRG